MENSNLENLVNTITNRRFFEKEIINYQSQFYYYFKIQEYTKYKNSQLVQNVELISKIEILKVFNNKIQSLMFQIISCYKLAIELEKENKQVSCEGLLSLLTRELEYLNTAIIPSINLIYDQNNLLAYKVNDYCINGFKMMFDKLQDENFINIKESPLYPKIEKVYNKYLNLYDIEKIKILSTPIEETETPLDKIRNNNYSNLELITILKKLSNNYESELLRALLRDIDFYLFVEKEEMECEFSLLDVENAVQKLVENNIEIPYHKKTPFEKLTDKGKKFATRLKENGFIDTPTLNQEQLLFPYEFFEIYRFKNLINSKLNELTPTEPATENEQNKVYFKVGLLFAKKEIYKNVVTIDGYKKVNYYFKDEVFDNPNQLSKRLSLSRQYINDSFTGAKTKHNIFNNLKQLNNIIEYCDKNEIIIDVEFLNKYSVLLENRH